jgi:hypothetical protein
MHYVLIATVLMAVMVAPAFTALRVVDEKGAK